MRYPGNKTLPNPHIRAWLGGMDTRPRLLIEPFRRWRHRFVSAPMQHS